MVGHGLGVLTFSLKKKKLSFHPWIKIIGQIPDPRQVKVVKCPSNLDRVQNPYLGERPQDQIPTVRPTFPPPLRLNIVRCITAIAVLNLLVSSQYDPPNCSRSAPESIRPALSRVDPPQMIYIEIFERCYF